MQEKKKQKKGKKYHASEIQKQNEKGSRKEKQSRKKEDISCCAKNKQYKQLIIKIIAINKKLYAI